MKAVGIIFSNIHDNKVSELARMRTMASIPFGGRYRLIDFPLSNMVNSGIDTVGIITKRNYQSLMDHVGSGKDWDLARKDGGVIILPPFGEIGTGNLYNTRLEALKGVTNFITRADEEFVVLTDCDGIFRLDYNTVIEEHIKNNADMTLVYKCMTKSETKNDEITAFELASDNRITNIHNNVVAKEEKNNVFMNVVVMRRNLLYSTVMDAISQNKRHLLTDVVTSNLSTLKIYAFEHKGYYAGITSLMKYYENNLELLKPDVRHELFGDRSVYTKIRDSAPTKYGNSSIIKNSMIADGCVIEGEVENSVIFRNVKIARGAKVKNSIIMQNTVIGENATINCIISDKGVVVRDKRVLSGSENHPFYIGKNTMI